MKKLIVPLLAMGFVVFVDFSYAAFGSARSSAGVSRSYSRPASSPSYSSPSYSKPATTYNNTSYSRPAAPSSQPSQSYNYNRSSSYSSEPSQSYAPRQNSAMRDIGVTAAGVAGGVLAASAITSLVSSPNHSGMYTHPQYPGQYFNQQGQLIPAPSALTPPVEQVPQQYTQPQYQQAPQPVVIYQQPQQPVKESGFSFIGMLWSVLWFLIKLAFFFGVVGAIGYGIYKLIQLGRNKTVRDQVQGKIQEKFNPQPTGPSDLDDLHNNAMDIFYGFQANSNNETWVTENTKYLPVQDCLAPPSRVLQYEHRTVDCVTEQGKIRGSVLYKAVVDDGTGEVEVHQYWNFEKDAGKWKLIGFEQID